MITCISVSRGLSVILFLGALLSTTAPANSATVKLAWDANTESNIAGYRVHYGTTAMPYTELQQVSTNSATLTDLVSGTTYLIAVSAYNTDGAESLFSAPIVYVPGTSGVQAATLDNISSRALVTSGEDVMIGGFIVQTATPKQVALRALGPSLGAAGVAGALQDPVLELHDANGVLLATNDNWTTDSNAAALSALGLAPTQDNEAALIATLPAGAYSAWVYGKGNDQGVALFELYNLDHSQGSVVNISTRALVQLKDDVLIGGFIISGTQPEEVIVRAIGPSLAKAGISDPLLDPTLDLYDSNGVLINSNDDWRSTQEAAIIATTIPPTDDRESAIVATLAPGAYSAVVSGKNNTTGVGLFEVYALSE